MSDDSLELTRKRMTDFVFEQVRAAVAEERERSANLLEAACEIIANAGEGDWNREHPKWKRAAEKWRDEYHAPFATGARGQSPATEHVHDFRISDWRGQLKCMLCGVEARP